MALSQGTGWGTLPLTPALIGTNPLLLVVLTGSTTALVAVGAFVAVGRTALWLAVLAGFVGLFWTAPLTYWAGRQFGGRLLTRVAHRPRSRQTLERAERLFRRYGIGAVVAQYYLPVPNAAIQLAAGISGVAWVPFLIAESLAALTWELPALGLGYGLGRAAVHVAEAISADSLQVSLVVVFVVIVVAALRRRRAQPRASG